MLRKLTVRNFKSLVDVTVEFPRLAVLFGPNAAGKSNLLDAIATLSGIGNVRTLSDVLDRPLPVRGHAFEAFSFPAGGLPALVKQRNARFSLEADLAVGTERYRYRVEPSIELRSGRLSVADEYLALLGRTGNPKGTPAIERVDSKLRVRRKEATRPRLLDRLVAGCPNPHVERWFLADPDSFHKVVGYRPVIGREKYEREHYKRLLIDAIPKGSQPATLGGIEFAAELVDAMNLYRAGRSDSSLRAFVGDLRSRFREIRGSAE